MSATSPTPGTPPHHQTLHQPGDAVPVITSTNAPTQKTDDRAAEVKPIEPDRSTRKLLRSLIRTGLVRFLSAFGTMMLSIVLARTLTKDDFGLFSFCMFALVTLSMLSRYGLDSVLLRFGGSAWHAGDLKRFRGYGAWATWLTSRNALLFTIVGGVFLYALGAQRWSGVSIMSWMLISLLPWSLLYTISFVFKAAHRTPTGSMFEVGTINHLTWIAVIVMAGAGWTVTASHVAITLLVCSFVVCIAGFWMLKANDMWPKHAEVLESEKPEFIHTCRSVVVIVIMQMLANMGGVFFLGIMWNNEEVAAFSAPLRLATATILLTNVVILVIAPRLSGYYKAGEIDKFKKMLRTGCLAVFGINVPILLTLAIMAPWVMQLMPAYVEHWHLLSIIALGQVIGIVAGLAPTVMCMTGYERIWSKATFCNAVFCIILTATLCYFWGALGAALGAATYQATQNWVAACLVRWHHGYWTIPRVPVRAAIKTLSR